MRQTSIYICNKVFFLNKFRKVRKIASTAIFSNLTRFVLANKLITPTKFGSSLILIKPFHFDSFHYSKKVYKFKKNLVLFLIDFRY